MKILKTAGVILGSAAVLSVGLVAGGVGPAFGTSSTNEEGVCANLDTGHLSAGGAASYTITAPAGKVIVQVCVKAGSINQGNGPEYTSFDPGVTSVTISHSSGKDISHYSVKYADEDEPPTTTGEEPPTTTGEEPPTTTGEEPPVTTTTPPRVCPDGKPPTPGEGAYDPNDDCKRPPTETTPTTSTPTPTTPVTSTPTPTTPTETTPTETSSTGPVTKPPAAKPKPDKPVTIVKVEKKPSGEVKITTSDGKTHTGFMGAG